MSVAAKGGATSPGGGLPSARRLCDIAQMNNRFILAALALSAILARPVAAAPVQPTGKWVVDFAPSQCTAVRDYGTVDRPLALVLKPSVIGDVMTVAIVRGGASPAIGEHSVIIRLDQGPSFPASLLAFSPKSGKQRVEMINLPLETFSAVRRSTLLAIAGTGVASRSFALSGMVPLMKAMDACLADLQQLWNVSEVARAQLKQAPMSKKSLAKLFDSRDYPSGALNSRQSGSLAFALLIDETGKIADCTVIATSGVATLDSQSCAVVKERAVFDPAVGSDGKPAKSAVIQRIRWEMP